MWLRRQGYDHLANYCGRGIRSREFTNVLAELLMAARCSIPLVMQFGSDDRKSAMKSLHITFALLLATAVSASSAYGDILGDLEGSWRGIFSDEQAGAADNLPDASLTISRRSDGFEASWTGADGETRSTNFVRVEGRSFYAEETSGGVFGMFGNKNPPNPLAGDALTWARLNDEQFIVYRLEIGRSGAYELLKNIYARDSDGFALDAGVWLHGKPMSRMKSRLERVNN